MRPPRYHIETEERIVPAYDGVNTNDSPTIIPTTQAPVVDNFLVGRKGQLLMRGPINQSLAVTYGGTLQALWIYDDTLLICTGTRTRGSRYPGAGGTALSGAGVQAVSLGALTQGAWTTAPYPGGPHTRLGSFVWGRTANAGTNGNIGDVNGPAFPNYTLMKWDGTSTAASVSSVANSPVGFFDVKAWLNRLFVLGGKAADGTDTYIQPNTLFWSDFGGPVAGTVANWQDDVSGLTNRLVLDSDDRNDTCIALARLGRSLAILKRKSIHLLTGTTPANFAVRRVLSGTGCISQESVVELDDAVIFASDAGLMLFDGANLVNLSQGVQAEFLGATLSAATIRCGRLAGNQLLVTALDDTDTVLFARVLHLPSRSWWTLSSNIFFGTLPVAANQSATISWGWDGVSVFLLDKAMTPELTVVTERGFDQAGLTKKRIPARWWSRLTELVLPTRSADIKRLLMDYSFPINGGTDTDGGWFVSAVNGSGKTLLAETQIPAQAGSGSTYAYRRQASVDVFAETAHDIQLRVQWRDDGSNTYPAVVKGEIHDAFVEFSAAQERQST